MKNLNLILMVFLSNWGISRTSPVYIYDSVETALFTSQYDTITMMVSNTTPYAVNYEIISSADTTFDIVPLSMANIWTYLQEISGSNPVSVIRTDSVFESISYSGISCYLVKEDIIYNNKTDRFTQTKVDNYKEYFSTKTWRIDEFGNFWEGYGEDPSDFDELLMVGNPRIGMVWDSTGSDDYTRIIKKEDVDTPWGTFFDCWKVENMQSGGYKAYRYFKKGVGLVKYEYLNDAGVLIEKETLKNYSIDPKWLAVSDRNVLIIPDSAIQLKFIFDASDLYSGNYTGYVNLRSHDSVNNNLSVKVKLKVTGVPLIERMGLYNFGEVFIGNYKKVRMRIKNTGTEKLVVDSIVCTNNVLTVDTTWLLIWPGSEFEIELTFKPQNDTLYTESLKIYSNAFNDNEFDIAINGEGLNPPEIIVFPNEIYIEVLPDEKVSKTLTIENNGFSTLNWHLLLGDSLSINSFMPLQVGNKWVYKDDNYINPDIREIIRDTIVNNIKYYIYNDYRSDFSQQLKSENIKYTQWDAFRIDDFGNVFDASYFTNFYGNDTITEKKIMIGNPSVGKEWYPYDNAYDSYKIIDQANLETLGGLIEDCWVVEYFYNYPQGSNYFTYFWKEGLGMVKQSSIFEYNLGDISYSYDTIILSDCKLNGPHWISSNDSSGSIVAGEQQQITLNVDASLMESESNEAYIKILSNDPLKKELLIPVIIKKLPVGISQHAFGEVMVYPNPASNDVTISLCIKNPGFIKLNACDIYGRIIDEIYEGNTLPGKYTFIWNTRLVRNNICIINIRGAGVSLSKWVQINK